jgi:hypothetical protein
MYPNRSDKKKWDISKMAKLCSTITTLNHTANSMRLMSVIRTSITQIHGIIPIHSALSCRAPHANQRRNSFENHTYFR